MKRLAVPVAVLSTGLLAGACGSTDTATHDMSSMSSMSATPAESRAPVTSSAADHNERDIWFARMMIPHHRQALEMARLVEGRAAGGKVKELARKIEAAQDPEIRTMTGWLESWGVQVPGEGVPINHMDHDMPGMMSGEDMNKLKGLEGAAFDRAFLTMMIQHHEGAVTMAEEEQGAGVYEPARRLAGSIITSQSAEISTMRKLLK